MNTVFSEDFPLKEETYRVIGICMEVHKVLGHGFAEIVYKDAMELELNKGAVRLKERRSSRLIIRASF